MAKIYLLPQDREKIEDLLFSVGMSKTELAKKAGYSAQSISNFLNGNQGVHKNLRKKVYPILKQVYLQVNEDKEQINENQFEEEFGFIKHLGGYEVNDYHLIKMQNKNQPNYFKTVWDEFESRLGSLVELETNELRPLYLRFVVNYALSSNQEREELKEGLERLVSS